MKIKLTLFFTLLFISFFIIQNNYKKEVFAADCNQKIVDKSDECLPDCYASPYKKMPSGEVTSYICYPYQTGSNNEGKITNPALNANVGTGEGETILAKILAAVINLFFIAGSIAVLVYLLMGGLAWITSEGDKGKLEIARSRLTSAIFGIVVIAAAYAILKLIGGFLGINFFTDLIIKWPTITQ